MFIMVSKIKNQKQYFPDDEQSLFQDEVARGLHQG